MTEDREGRVGPDDYDVVPTTPGLVCTTVIGVASGLLALIDLLVGLPMVLVLAAATLLVVGMGLSGILAYRYSRRSGAPMRSILWRSLTAPIRFIIDYTF